MPQPQIQTFEKEINKEVDKVQRKFEEEFTKVKSDRMGCPFCKLDLARLFYAGVCYGLDKGIEK